MPRRIPMGKNVFDAAIERMVEVFQGGNRVVVSFSAGKDSGVCVEICLAAMHEVGKGNGGFGNKLDVVMRDEEVMYPGTFEYAERIAARDDVRFHWLVANQPIVNVFNRAAPYFWVFDPMLDPEQWVRQPPPYAEHIQGLHIGEINRADRFPHKEGTSTYHIMGLRASESARRTMAVFSAGGAFSIDYGGKYAGIRWGNPIYDWKDEDVWRAIAINKWDYNSAYDVMNKMGVPKKSLRIAPPTMNQAAVRYLGIAAKAWPHWFDKVSKRLPGVRTAAQYGMRAVQPHRRYGETWKDCFLRECITEAPAQWLANRCSDAMQKVLDRHAKHSTSDLPDVKKCMECGDVGCWRELALYAYNGDPFCLKLNMLSYVEPEFFRAGAGTWAGGKPTW